MSDIVEQPPKSFGEKLQSLNRFTLYVILMALISASLFLSQPLPNKPTANGLDMYTALMSVPTGSTILVQSDFTLSTRGENGAQLEALLRILIRRNLNVAFISVGDPQAPQVARDIMARTIVDEKAEDRYKPWQNWVSCGFFPNAEAAGKVINQNLRQALSSRKDNQPGIGLTNVTESPVLAKVNTISDLGLYVVVTGTKSIDVLMERLKFRPVQFGDRAFNTRIGAMVTGVMGPQNTNYYKAGQQFGLAIGLNGVVELENMMDKGVNDPTSPTTIKTPTGQPVIPAFKGQKNLARGMNYYFSLHMALALLILAILAGNVGMVLSRKAKGETR